MDYFCMFYGYPKYFEMLQKEWLNKFREYYYYAENGLETDTPMVAEVKPFLIRSPIHQKKEFEEFVMRSTCAESLTQFKHHPIGRGLLPFPNLMMKALEPSGFKKWEWEIRKERDIVFPASETGFSFLARKVDKYYEPNIKL